MKYITFAIPSYNSESYLHNAVDSLLVIGNEAEIIIVNDGSKDKTLEIALEYEKKFPNIIKVIDKENGGHGSGVNSGLQNANGLYYKVVDSDDWIDQKNVLELVALIKEKNQNNDNPDLYIMDFIYEHVSDNTTFVRTYKDNFTHNKTTSWEGIKKSFKYSKTLLMHSLVYKTEVLRKSEISLPNHTFYVDNIFAYTPLPFVQTIHYIPKVLYHYYIGRSDQSIQIHNIVSRYMQQIKVMDILLKTYSYEQISNMPKKLKKYLKHFLAAIMIITQMFTTAEYSIERKKALKQLWNDLKIRDKRLYRFLKYRSFNVWVNFLPWRLKGFVMVKGYLYFAKKIKLG